MRRRTSLYLSRLKSELRRHALHADNEADARDYWRMYYRAVNAEQEVRELVLEAEVRCLLEFVFPDGIPDSFSTEDDEPDDPPQEKLSPKPLDEDDIPPQQKGFWD